MTHAPYAYYSVAASPPPVGVVVVVIWDGRPPFEAALVAHPRTRKPAWLTHDHGRAVILPCDMPPPDPKRPWAGWHTLKGSCPDYWRPKHPDKWQQSLPEPAYVETDAPPAGRMWSATQRFDATAAVEEMEADREAARARGREPQEAEPPEAQWWLDPHAVTYPSPGRISMREAEGRLMRAFAAEWWVRVEWPRLKTFGDILANLAKTLPLAPGELAAQDPAPVRAMPTGRDQDDMLTALGWLQALGGVHKRSLTARSRNSDVFIHGAERRSERRLLRMSRHEEDVLRLRGSTPPLTWRRIGEDVGRSCEAARGIYQLALAVVTEAANGGPTPETAAVRATRDPERPRLNALRSKKRQQRASCRRHAGNNEGAG